MCDSHDSVSAVLSGAGIGSCCALGLSQGEGYKNPQLTCGTKHSSFSFTLKE